MNGEANWSDHVVDFHQPQRRTWLDTMELGWKV